MLGELPGASKGPRIGHITKATAQWDQLPKQMYWTFSSVQSKNKVKDQMRYHLENHQARAMGQVFPDILLNLWEMEFLF